MSGVVWDFGSAARISRAVRKVEQTGQSQFDDLGFAPLADGNREWVRTPSSLPGGYDGSDPLDGVKVVRLPDGTIHAFPQTVSILDPNGTALAANTIYPAQFAGTYEVSAGVNQGLYLVQGVPDPPPDPPVVQLGYYNGGTIFGANGSDINRTNIVVWETGATLTIRGHPWGQDAPAVLTGVGSNNLFGQPNWWQILLRDTNYDTQNWAIVPFMPWCQAQYLSGTSPQVVSCRAYGATGSTAMTWRAWDPLNLVPNPGVYQCIMAPYAALNGTYRIGWQIIWCNSASPVSASSVGVD